MPTSSVKSMRNWTSYEVLFLGYDALNRPIRVDPEDRKIHTHVIGASGGGKSKSLEWMIRGDLKNRQGFVCSTPAARSTTTW